MSSQLWDVTFKLLPKDVLSAFLSRLLNAKNVAFIGPLETVPSKAPLRADLVATADDRIVLVEYFSDRTALDERAFYSAYIKAISLARDRGVSPLEIHRKVAIVFLVSSSSCLRGAVRSVGLERGVGALRTILDIHLVSLSDVELQGDARLLYILGERRREEGLRVALNMGRLDVFTLGLTLLRPERRKAWVSALSASIEDAFADIIRLMMEVRPDMFGKAIEKVAAEREDAFADIIRLMMEVRPDMFGKAISEVLVRKPDLARAVLREVARKNPDILKELLGNGDGK